MSVVHVWLRQNYSVCPFNQCLLSRGVWPVIIGQSGWPDDSRYRGLTRSTSLHACLSVRGRYAASSLMSDVTAWEQASKYDDRCRRRRQRRVSDAISTLVRSEVAKRSNSLCARLHSDGVYAEQSVCDCVPAGNSQMPNSLDKLDTTCSRLYRHGNHGFISCHQSDIFDFIPSNVCRFVVLILFRVTISVFLITL